MESQRNTNSKRGASMAFPIDLNESPISSRREAANDAVSGGASVSICTECRKGVPGRRAEKENQERRREFKCFRCLLQSNGGSSSSGGVETGRVHISAASPREAEADDVAVLDCRSGDGGAKTQASLDSCFSSHARTTRHLKPVLEDIRHNLPSYVATESAKFRFQDMLQQRVRPDANGIALRGSTSGGAPCSSHVTPKTGLLGSGSRRDGIKDGFPIQFQDFCLISTGNVDLRPSYHNRDQIWPIGYRSSWHDRITGSLFICDIADGGNNGPIFKVKRYPCTKQSIPVGSTILSKKTPLSSKGDGNVRIDNSARPQTVDVDVVKLSDIIGEFQFEARSTPSVWEMVSKAFLYACQEAYKKKGTLNFYCDHNVNGLNNEDMGGSDSLSRFCYFNGLVSIPAVVKNEEELNMTCEMMMIWLNQDRFGLDADFVQEIIEQLPGVTACPDYRYLNYRKQNSGLRTVGSGFFQVERKRDKRGPCPLGKSLNSNLPFYLLGDALQVWELAWRFLDVLGLEQPFSFHELESELVLPWLDDHLFYLRHGTVDSDNSAPSSVEKDSNGRFNGLLLTKILVSLLNLLVSELLSKTTTYVCPDFDSGESKSKRSKKKDLDFLATLKKIKLDMLPVNGLTWHEIARRYISAVLSMQGNLDFTEIAGQESGKVFHCLRGDGGIAALEGDAVILADARKEIFGSLKGENEAVTVFEGEPNTNDAPMIEVNDNVIPEWAKVLEPVRKLPTNVGARLRRCINEALEKNPPEWAKKMLEHSISKEVYKGNASGPTKRAVIAVLAKVTPEEPQQKARKKNKVNVKTNVTNLITKQCRIVLRRFAASYEDGVLCDLLGRIILKPNDNDDEGFFGYPAMVSRPLDFRTIDKRLAAGAYGGSHEAFIDDVREVWHNIHAAYGDQSDLIDVAERLSQKFEDLYEKDVLTFVQKIDEISKSNDPSADAIKERDDLLANVGKSPLPRAPWEKGICKVCKTDKDDDNVVLCYKCDFGYHRYCLNPPLLKIPEGNWYCPSCITGQSVSCISVANQSQTKRDRGEFTRMFLEKLTRLANLLEMKEYWEFTLEERVFFMKFLFDEALNSATIRDHMGQSASWAADLQHKLESRTSELKILKVRDEMFGLSAEKANPGDAHVSRNDIFAHAQYLKDSIASTESELMKVSLRKNLLGRDSNGRIYWAFHCHGARPWIIANGGLESKEKLPYEFAGVPDSTNWMYYESNDDIEKLVGWLKDNNVREKELKESILQLQSNKLKDSDYTEKHFLSKGEPNVSIFSSGREPLSPDFLATKAMTALEKRFGPRPKVYRCECLELLWTFNHCSSCHQNFPTNEELRQHSNKNCNATASVSKKRQTTEDVPNSKKSKNVVSQEKARGNMGNLHASTSGKQKDVVFSECYQKTSRPFNFEDIMARFVFPNSLKDRVNEIGLIGNGGIPSFLPSRSHYLSDPALSLGPTRMNKSCSTEMPTSSSRASDVDRVKDKSSLLGLSRSRIVRESSSRPLVGRDSEILRILKIHLLDMDAALPEDALRTSRTNQDKRCVWRAFVKSAKSIYEMVQAMIILEDTIKAEYLTNGWWYCSPPSTAAKITTLSALALRLYALDSAIFYEKPSPKTTQILEPNAIDEDLPLASSSSPQLQKTPEPETQERVERANEERI